MLDNFCRFVNVSFYQKFGAIEKICRYIKRFEAMVLRMYEKFEGIEKRCRDLWNICGYMTTYSVYLMLVAICKVCRYIKSGVLWFISHVKGFTALWKGYRHKKVCHYMKCLSQWFYALLNSLSVYIICG